MGQIDFLISIKSHAYLFLNIHKVFTSFLIDPGKTLLADQNKQNKKTISICWNELQSYCSVPRYKNKVLSFFNKINQVPEGVN